MTGDAWVFLAFGVSIGWMLHLVFDVIWDMAVKPRLLRHFAPPPPLPPVRWRHESWCDTRMPSAAHWAAQGIPVRCNCDDTGPGTMRAVIDAYEGVRVADRRAQEALGITLPPMPPAQELMDK